ncbi:UvrD-helicase domain-containing protein [Agrobacterium salinitolerans]|uniref:UvrD-helicase domain-containing protein n=1 Tax=Agrobacterium salinitolerans TaxID=1183413 RepID=UPI003FD67656
MSWWVNKNQLDDDQLRLIEKLPIEGNYLVLGPPGSGKTNVLLRRAQFLRAQELPNIVILTFTRSLTEFLKTGCYNESGSEVFPPDLITTYESWIRSFYYGTGQAIPNSGGSFEDRKAELARGALAIVQSGTLPKYDAIFIDEAQDLLPEEVALISDRSDRLFFVGDDRQKIFGQGNGLESVRSIAPSPVEEKLPFHYRLAPEICAVADRILTNISGQSLSKTAHYNGPKPARVELHGLQDRTSIKNAVIKNIVTQVRAYGDLLSAGDRLGVVVPKKDDRDDLFSALENNPDLAGKAQIVRARNGDEDDDHITAIDPERPILVMTEKGCKGLEFRALHWLFVDQNANRRTDELYYTVVTRAKTSLDMYHSSSAPPTIAKAYVKPAKDLWA